MDSLNGSANIGADQNRQLQHTKVHLKTKRENNHENMNILTVGLCSLGALRTHSPFLPVVVLKACIVDCGRCHQGSTTTSQRRARSNREIRCWFCWVLRFYPGFSSQPARRIQKKTETAPLSWGNRFYVSMWGWDSLDVGGTAELTTRQRPIKKSPGRPSNVAWLD